MTAVQEVDRKKLVIVGDGACGKTSLLFVFTKDEMPMDYVPTIFDNYVADMKIGNKQMELSLFDTAGQEDYDALRILMYDGADVVVLCYNIASPDTLANVTEKWMPEVREHCPGIPIVLCGNKKDLRNNDKVKQELAANKQKPLGIEDGIVTAKKIGASEFFETSALTKAGVMDLFNSAAYHSLKKLRRRSSSRKCTKCLRCCIV